VKRGIWGLLLISIVTTTAVAGEWEPYLGVIGKVGAPIVSSGIEIPESSEWLEVPFSAGMQYEIGTRHDNLQLYLAYSHLNSVIRERGRLVDFPEGSTLWEENYDWGERRFLLGARLHSKGESFFQGVIGGAFSLGRSVYRHTYWEDYMLSSLPFGIPPRPLQSTNQHRQSSISPGFMLETGVNFRLTNSLDCLLLGQFHRYESSFGSDPNYYTVDHAVILSPELSLGLTYSFNQLSI
jgi:hypothetical protein